MKGKTWRERNPEAFNAAWRKWYRANVQRKTAWQKRRRHELREWFLEIKSTKRCERCEESAPECLHFDHVDPATKEFDVADISTYGCSKERILAEIAKCVVLCANCHFKQHWAEKEFERLV